MERLEIAQTSLNNAKSMIDMYERTTKSSLFKRNLRYWKKRVKYWQSEIDKIENAKKAK